MTTDAKTGNEARIADIQRRHWQEWLRSDLGSPSVHESIGRALRALQSEHDAQLAEVAKGAAENWKLYDAARAELAESGEALSDALHERDAARAKLAGAEKVLSQVSSDRDRYASLGGEATAKLAEAMGLLREAPTGWETLAFREQWIKRRDALLFATPQAPEPAVCGRFRCMLHDDCAFWPNAEHRKQEPGYARKAPGPASEKPPDGIENIPGATWTPDEMAKAREAAKDYDECFPPDPASEKPMGNWEQRIRDLEAKVEGLTTHMEVLDLRIGRVEPAPPPQPAHRFEGNGNICTVPGCGSWRAAHETDTGSK